MGVMGVGGTRGGKLEKVEEGGYIYIYTCACVWMGDGAMKV